MNNRNMCGGPMGGGYGYGGNPFLNGRNGFDPLSRFMFGCAIAVIVIRMCFGVRLLGLLALVLIGLAYFRIFSTNVAARQKENQAYLRLRGRFTSFFAGIGQRFRTARQDLRDLKHRRSVLREKRAQDPESRYFVCPKCRQIVRVPRGKGRIMVRCPKCGTEFAKRS